MKLPGQESNSGPPLQVRPEPAPPTKSEKRILDLLWREFRKADAAARAGARFDIEVHEKLVQQRIDDGMAEDEAGDIRRVFNPDDFNETFRRFLQLRMDRMILGLLGLQDYESEIMQERIKQVFEKPVKRTKQIAVSSDQIQVGNAETQQIQDLKRRGRRRRK